MTKLGPGAVCCGDPARCDVDCGTVFEETVEFPRFEELPEPTPEELHDLDDLVEELLADEEEDDE